MLDSYGEVAEPDSTCFVHTLLLSMEHLEWASINAPPHSEACFEP